MKTPEEILEKKELSDRGALTLGKKYLIDLMQEYAEAYHEEKEREEIIGFLDFTTKHDIELMYINEPKWVTLELSIEKRYTTSQLYDKYKSETNK